MEEYKKPKVSDWQDETKDLSVYKRERKSRLLTRDVQIPVTKYFTFLSGLTVKELRDIARKCMIRGYSRYRKTDLIRFIDCRCVIRDSNTFYIWRLNDYVSDITHELVQNCIEKRMFQDSMRAWVGLFVSDKSVSEHYAQIILGVLSPMKCFEERSDVVYSVKKLNGCNILFREPDYTEYEDQSEDSDEGLPDDW